MIRWNRGTRYAPRAKSQSPTKTSRGTRPDAELSMHATNVIKNIRTARVWRRMKGFVEDRKSWNVNDVALYLSSPHTLTGMSRGARNHRTSRKHRTQTKLWLRHKLATSLQVCTKLHSVKLYQGKRRLHTHNIQKESTLHLVLIRPQVELNEHIHRDSER